MVRIGRVMKGNKSHIGRGTSRKGWLLYDDACAFCRTWVPFWKNTLRKRGFEIAPLQSEWVSRSMGMETPDLLKDVRLLPARGGHIAGADVYRYIMKRIWWAYPFYLISILPGIRSVFDRSYAAFAKRRY